MLTDPPKELLFQKMQPPKVALIILIIWRPFEGAPEPAPQVFHIEGIALLPGSSFLFNRGAVNGICGIFAAEIVDVAIVDFIEIEGAEKVVVLRALNLIPHPAQVKVTPIQGTQLLGQRFLETLEVLLFVAQ
jgi:hypothetical protein